MAFVYTAPSSGNGLPAMHYRADLWGGAQGELTEPKREATIAALDQIKAWVANPATQSIKYGPGGRYRMTLAQAGVILMMVEEGRM